MQDMSRSTQVFMTTFKKVSFPEDNASYFSVDWSQDKPASIQKVDVFEASSLLESGKRS